MGHFLAYCILPEGVTIIIIKLDGLLKILWHLDSILLIDGVLLSIGSRDLGHPNELLGVLVEEPFQPTLGRFEYLIISCI